MKTLTWSGKPPAGISFQTHKFALLDFIEQASVLMDTDYTKDVEYIIVGRKGRALVETLPHLCMTECQNGLLPIVKGKGGHIGRLGKRECYWVPDKDMEAKVKVVNPREQVEILLQDLDFGFSPAQST